MAEEAPPERTTYRVIVYRMEFTLKGEPAWKNMYDVRGPSTTTRRALAGVARHAQTDPKAEEPVPTPVAKRERPPRRKRKEKVTVKVRHPEIVVATGGLDAMGVVTRVRTKMRRAGVSSEEMTEFGKMLQPNGLVKMPERDEVMRVVRQWITVKTAAKK